MPTRKNTTALIAALLFSAAAAVIADDFAINWYTVDGGGAMTSTGGDFALSGTIGQHDASTAPMTGGDFSLTGGFWQSFAVCGACCCPGDVNADSRVNGGDVAGFVGCLLAPGGDCSCADLNTSGAADVADIGLFIADVLASSSCP